MSPDTWLVLLGKLGGRGAFPSPFLGTTYHVLDENKRVGSWMDEWMVEWVGG